MADNLDLFPSPEPAAELNVRVVRINENEGLIQNGAVVTQDYVMLANERYIITDQEITITLADVNAWKAVSIRNNSGGDVTLLGGDNTINGATGILIATLTTENLVFTGEEWNTL
jgi:hypothetical protein